MRNVVFVLSWFSGLVVIALFAITIPAYNWPVAVPEAWNFFGRLGLGFAILAAGEIIWLGLGLVGAWILDDHDTKKEGTERA